MAILGWGIGLGLLMAVAFATATPAVLAGFASLAPLFRFLGDPYAMQTPEGYITFRYLGTIVPLLLSFWPILAGARLVRGEEERGTWHAGCAARHATATRSPAIREDRALLIVVLFALGAVAGEARIEHHVDVVRALLARLNLSLLAFFFGMLALLLSQFTTSRGAAAGGASGLLLLALLPRQTGRSLLKRLRWSKRPTAAGLAPG